MADDTEQNGRIPNERHKNTQDQRFTELKG